MLYIDIMLQIYYSNIINNKLPVNKVSKWAM